MQEVMKKQNVTQIAEMYSIREWNTKQLKIRLLTIDKKQCQRANRFKKRSLEKMGHRISRPLKD